MNSSNQTELAEKALANPALEPETGTSGSPAIKLRLLAAIILALLALAVVAGLIPRRRQRAALRAQTRELGISTVTVVSIAPGKVSQGLALPAEIKAYMEAPIYARANGYLKRWLFDLGANVEAGQLLAEIDTPEINQDLLRARAEVAQA